MISAFEGGDLRVAAYTQRALASRPVRIAFLKRVVTSLQFVSDAVTIIASYMVGYQIWEWIGPKFFAKYFVETPFADYSFSIGITLLVMLAGFVVNGLYQYKRSILNIREYELILKTTLIAGAITLLIHFLAREQLFSRGVFLATWSVMAFLFFLQRHLFFAFQNKLRQSGVFETRALIYGAGTIGQKLMEKLVQSPSLGYHIQGFIDDHPHLHTKTVSGIPVIGKLSHLDQLLQETEAQELFLAISQIPRKTIESVVQSCKKYGCQVHIVPSLYDIAIQSVRMEEVDGIPLVGMTQPRYSWQTKVFKRLFDIVSSVILFVLLAPILTVLAALVRMSSEGPIFFKQKRVGKDGREFMFYKFRSMYVHAPKYGVTPQSGNDPRITPIGRFLRRSSLDELPQLFNVLKGDMSLVGPRPEMPFIVNTYNELQRQRLNVHPGITGLWQISADRKRAIHENMDYDLYYINNQSFILDMVIMLRTLTSCVRGIGAY